MFSETKTAPKFAYPTPNPFEIQIISGIKSKYSKLKFFPVLPIEVAISSIIK